jgi:hypothetical protein
MKSLFGLLLLVTAPVLSTPEALARDEDNPRLLVLTDISSLTAGLADPDDGQSLIRTHFSEAYHEA